MTAPEAAGGLPSVAQPVAAPLTRAAIFLVVTINPGPTIARPCGRSAGISLRCCARWSFATLKRAFPASWGLGPTRGTGSSDRRGRRNCIRSGRFAPERAMRSPRRATCCSTSAPSAWICASSWRRRSWRASATPFRRSTRCTASVTSTTAISSASSTARRIRAGEAAIDAVLIGDEDPAFAGGSYVIVQKYLHDLDAWNALSTEAQERIIGRTKLSDIELDDAVKPASAHNALTTIVENGKEIKILRDNMPFGQAGARRVRHLFHRLLPLAAHHRADAREHVRRPPARQLRPAARLQPRRHRQPVLRAVRDISGHRDRRRSPPARRAVRYAGAGRILSPFRQCTTVRSASVPSKETIGMNNLHRELAPISDAAWAQIEEETSRTLKRYLAGRRVVDVRGPARHRPLRRRHRPSAHDRGSGGRHPRQAARGEGAGRAAGAVRTGSPGNRRRRAWRQRLRLAARQGRRATDRLCRGPRHLRRLCRRRNRRHPPGDQQSDR